MKKLLGLYNPPPGHWVGDGFPARSLFSYGDHGADLSPFLLLDRAGPYAFDKTDKQRGVGQHPHRGFETVTIVYDGEVSHRDSAGGGGTIGPGDVQWMTAGSGILHEEFHSEAFAKAGGTLDMVQLWVNLPAADKMTTPRYQALQQGDIPVMELADDAGQLRVIAGDYAGQTGAAKTFSPVDVWDVQLNAGGKTQLSVAAGRTLGLVMLKGNARLNGEHDLREAQLAILDREAGDFTLEAVGDAKILVLSGEPLEEPVFGHGPFVMNSREQIVQAITDFNSGRFGQLQ